MKRSTILIAAFVMATPVFAATKSANLPINAAVVANCTISTSAVNFGNYDPVGTNAATDLDSSGTVTVACTKGAGLSIDLDLGLNAAGAARQMNDGGTNMLGYELYTTNARTIVWGTGASGLTITPAPDKTARNFTVYGRVAAGQDAAIGTYADTVVATINY
jgi:spore coat protein U-like protein